MKYKNNYEFKLQYDKIILMWLVFINQSLNSCYYYKCLFFKYQTICLNASAHLLKTVVLNITHLQFLYHRLPILSSIITLPHSKNNHNSDIKFV